MNPMECDISEASSLQRFANHCCGLLHGRDFVALNGPLASGKTTFARQLIACLAARHGAKAPHVASPTFNLVHTYNLGACEVWHFDLYRLKDGEEVLEIGYQEARGAICLVEWAARLGALLPDARLDITFYCDDGAKTPSYHARLDDRRGAPGNP